MILSGEMEAVSVDVQVGLVVTFDCVLINMKKKYLWNTFNNNIKIGTKHFLNTLKVHIENVLKVINNSI